MSTLYSRTLENFLIPLHNTVKGRHYVKDRKFLEESQWWPRQKLAELQWRDMEALVKHAFTSVPYYQKKYADAGIRLQDIQSPRDFARLPPLTRRELNAHREELRSTAYQGRFIAHATGGSGGVPSRFYISIESYDWRTACTERVYAWSGVHLGERAMSLWGAPVGKEPLWKSAKVKAFQTFRRQMIISTFWQSEEKWQFVFKTALRYKPKMMVGYVGSLEHYAEFLIANKLRQPGVQAVIAAAEPLFPRVRELLEKAFGAPVFNTYGCREFMSIGGECDQHRGIHLNAENILVESAKPASDGPSDLLVTDLHNYALPFLRYEIGDVGLLDDAVCSCGRGLPMLQSIVGRRLDVLHAADGRVIHSMIFPHTLKDCPEVIEFLATQKSLTHILLEAVMSEEMSEKSRALITGEVHKAFGPQMVLEIKRVESIPRLGSGKRRVTVGLGEEMGQ